MTLDFSLVLITHISCWRGTGVNAQVTEKKKMHLGQKGEIYRSEEAMERNRERKVEDGQVRV